MTDKTNIEKQPYISDITKEEAEALKRELRSLMVKEGYTIEKVADELKERYGVRESKNNLSNKLSRGSLRFIDVQRIANILGYDIQIIKSEKE
ncbi:MAG: DUF6471 domain-containing protein [Candidatus Gastranaerophilales bacterium]|nr:DUF6471 domain-containing protein [Candidatus Gastranaerophilales bacterium]